METVSGLFAKLTLQSIPLKSVSVRGTIRDVIAFVSVIQKYENTASDSLEVVYKFPLPEGAAVCGFQCKTGDRHVVGKVQEKNQALRTYSSAIDSGHGAYLLDEERPDVFTMNVGNLPAGETCEIQIDYVTELDVTPEGHVAFVLPTTIAPRYVPASDPCPVQTSLQVNAPMAASVPYRMTVELSLDMPAHILAVTSPSHPTAIVLTRDLVDSRKAAVEFSSPQRLDGSFRLHVQVADFNKPRVWRQRDEQGRDALMVAMYPSWGDTDLLIRSEFILVVDRSGSMQGPKTAQCRNALQIVLRSLPVGCKFNVVSFGSSFQKLFEASVEYSKETFAKASAAAERMEADLGGTELLQPLEAIFAEKPDPEFPRQIFVLTDGEVSDVEEVVAAVRANADRARLFTVGIGSGVSSALVKGIARAGRGECVVIADGERIEPAVLRQVERSLQPVLSNVRIDWGDRAGALVQAPYRLPAVFKGDRLIAYAMAKDLTDFKWPDTVTLSATNGTARLSYTLEVPAQPVSGREIHVLAGKQLIRGHQERCSDLYDDAAQLNANVNNADVKAAVVRLGVSYGLLSKFTSFVAVDLRSDSTLALAPMEVVVVPSLPPRDESRFQGLGPPQYGVLRCSRSRSRSRSRSPPSPPPPVYRACMSPSMACMAAPTAAPQARMAQLQMQQRRGSAPQQLSRPLPVRPQGVFHGAVNWLSNLGAPAAPPPPPTAPPAQPSMRAASARPSSASSADGVFSLPRKRSLGGAQGHSGAPEDEARVSRLHDAVVQLQGADGLWDMTADLADAVAIEQSIMRSCTPKDIAIRDSKAAGVEVPTLDTMWATAVAIAFLRSRCSNAEDEWKLLVAKALRALQAALTQYKCPATASTAADWCSLAASRLFSS